MYEQIDVEGFTSAETIVLTDITQNFLRYLYDRDLVVPVKILMDTGKRNRRVYTYSQLLEIKVFKNLRNTVPFRTIQSVQTFIRGNSENVDKYLDTDLGVLDVNGKIETYWVNDLQILDLVQKYAREITKMELTLITNMDKHVKEIEAVVNSGNCETVDIAMFRAKINGSKHLSLVA